MAAAGRRAAPPSPLLTPSGLLAALPRSAYRQQRGCLLWREETGGLVRGTAVGRSRGAGVSGALWLRCCTRQAAPQLPTRKQGADER